MIAVKDDSQKQINLIKESDMEKEHFVETKDGLTLLISYTIKSCPRIIFYVNAKPKFSGNIPPGV
jgi:hypothetical protein